VQVSCLGQLRAESLRALPRDLRNLLDAADKLHGLVLVLHPKRGDKRVRVPWRLHGRAVRH
jgi:hypothetical protein